MVYLTYIIDHYDALPDTVLFFHAHQITWHNNFLLDLDAAKTIERLNDARVARMGYMNTRCHLDPGCPDWIHLDRPEEEYDEVHKAEEKYFTLSVWRELHPFTPIPKALSQPCCAQFAVSGERIRARPKAEYEHYRNWLLHTTLEDTFAGRIMEYTWQVIFTGEPEFCPKAHSCYCDGYGVCFGGAQGLQDWLDMLRRREILEEEIEKIEKAKEESKDKEGTEEIVFLRKRVRELDEELDKRKKEAYERGEDPKNRAKELH
jgi:hypothetical protein